jgi:hypothetical protein
MMIKRKKKKKKHNNDNNNNNDDDNNNSDIPSARDTASPSPGPTALSPQLALSCV